MILVRLAVALGVALLAWSAATAPAWAGEDPLPSAAAELSEHGDGHDEDDEPPQQDDDDSGLADAPTPLHAEATTPPHGHCRGRAQHAPTPSPPPRG